MSPRRGPAFARCLSPGRRRRSRPWGPQNQPGRSPAKEGGSPRPLSRGHAAGPPLRPSRLRGATVPAEPPPGLRVPQHRVVFTPLQRSALPRRGGASLVFFARFPRRGGRKRERPPHHPPRGRRASTSTHGLFLGHPGAISSQSSGEEGRPFPREALLPAQGKRHLGSPDMGIASSAGATYSCPSVGTGPGRCCISLNIPAFPPVHPKALPPDELPAGARPFQWAFPWCHLPLCTHLGAIPSHPDTDGLLRWSSLTYQSWLIPRFTHSRNDLLQMRSIYLYLFTCNW